MTQAHRTLTQGSREEACRRGRYKPVWLSDRFWQCAVDSALVTDTEQGEQRGFATLLKGVFATFRNPVAHAPRISWQVSEQDALDLLTLASYLHRRLDGAVRTPR